MRVFFKNRAEKTHWHLKVLYISTFVLRVAFGVLLLLLRLCNGRSGRPFTERGHYRGPLPACRDAHGQLLWNVQRLDRSKNSHRIRYHASGDHRRVVYFI